jgi:hypothetical protein
MRLGAAAVTILIAAVPLSRAFAVDDAEALTIVRKHCDVPRRSAKKHCFGNHHRYQEARRDNFRAGGADQAMPLANQTGMTDDERATLAQWLKNQQ